MKKAISAKSIKNKKKINKITGTELTLKEKQFCELYASSSEFYGNGVQSYIKAYNVDLNKKGAYNVAKAEAYRMLTKPYILNYINELLEITVLNDTSIDKQIAFLITQNADFGSKLGAIKEYNALKNRIKQKIDITSNNQSIVSTEEEKLETAQKISTLFSSIVNQEIEKIGLINN